MKKYFGLIASIVFLIAFVVVLVLWLTYITLPWNLSPRVLDGITFVLGAGIFVCLVNLIIAVIKLKRKDE